MHKEEVPIPLAIGCSFHTSRSALWQQNWIDQLRNSTEHDQNYSRQGRPLINLFNNFELNLISSLSPNVHKLLNKSEARKQLEFLKARTKINQAWWVQQWMHPPSLRSIPYAVYPEICWNHKSVMDGQKGVWTDKPIPIASPTHQLHFGRLELICRRCGCYFTS